MRRTLIEIACSVRTGRLLSPTSCHGLYCRI